MDTADDELSSIYVSPQVETVLGLSADTFMTDDAWASHLHPDDRDEAERGIREAIRKGVPFTLEYRMIRPDGSVVWIRDQGNVVKDEDGRPAYVQGLYVDISEQKRLESELRSEAVKFKSLAERIPAVVYIEGEGGSDDAPFYISPQYEELFGYTPEERQANPTLWRELLHPEDRDRAIEAAERSYDEGGFSEDYRMVARDGRVVWVHDETVLIRDEEGKPLFWQGVMYDISEQKRAEQELAQALDMERLAVERLREADDMKNTFLTAVSHDLRTPLSAILGSAITLESADELGISQEDRRQLVRSLARKSTAPDRHGQRPARHGSPDARPGAAAARADGPGGTAGPHRGGVRRPGGADGARADRADRRVDRRVDGREDRREPPRERDQAHPADGDDLGRCRDASTTA